jgi:hypothetical protein
VATYPSGISAGTVADIASGALANYVPSIWSNKVLDFIEKELVCWNCIDDSYSAEFKGNKGDTLNINPLLEVTAAAVNTAAAPSVYDTDQGACTQLIINQWWEAVTGVSDWQARLGTPDYETKVIPVLAYAIAKKIDATVADQFNAFTQYVGTEGIAVDYDTLLAAKAYLDIADAPESDRFLIIDPETLQDLMGDDRFTSTNYNAGGAVAKGFVGQNRVLNCTVLVTSNLEAINTNYHGCTMMHRSAIAGAMIQDVSPKTWREESRHTTFHRAEAIWGLVEQRDTMGVWIRSRS